MTTATNLVLLDAKLKNNFQELFKAVKKKYYRLSKAGVSDS
jgi:hypothetical protein